MEDDKLGPLEKQIVQYMRTEIIKGNHCEFLKPEICEFVEKVTGESPGTINNEIGKLVGKNIIKELKKRGTEKKPISYYTLLEFLEAYRKAS